MSTASTRVFSSLVLLVTFTTTILKGERDSSSARVQSALSAHQAGCGTPTTDTLIQRYGARLRRHNDREIITVETANSHSTTATLSLWRRTGTCYQFVDGHWPAEVGANGVSEHKTEGDGTTPAGVFRIGVVMYGVSPNPGLAYPYHRIVCGDWWDEDASSSSYNQFIHVPCGTSPSFGGDSEALWQITPQYDYFAVVDYNSSPVISGRGSGIFLHIGVGEPTSGCVALPRTQLLAALKWMKPDAHPIMVIGVG